MTTSEDDDMNNPRFEQLPVEDMPVARVVKTDLKQMLLEFQSQAGAVGDLHDRMCRSDPTKWTAENYREIASRMLETMMLTLSGMAAMIQLQVNLKDDLGQD
jgi:hypothetical protein